MQNLEFTELHTLKQFPNDCVLDMDYFIKTLSEMKQLRPDVVGSIITHYASKWLPELSPDDEADKPAATSESITVSLTRKQFIIESLIGILPPDKDSIPCNFLLRLLRVANVVRVDPTYLSELEKRVSWQLDQASLNELMIPSFSHTSTTLFDVELVLRLVKRFVGMQEASRSGVAVMKVAKLVDCYLAETAADSCLGLPEFIELATALPSHARATDDGLYRAVDTYLKAHPGLPKQARKELCSLIDCNKLSQEACLHAAQNERIPVRAVIQVLLSEQSKLINKHSDWSGSLSGARSPACSGLDISARCFSKRETNIQQMEIKRLKEDVQRLQSQCMSMEKQIEKALERKRSGSYFSWKRLGFKANRIAEFEEESEAGFGPKTPLKVVRGRTPNRRKSQS